MRPVLRLDCDGPACDALFPASWETVYEMIVMKATTNLNTTFGRTITADITINYKSSSSRGINSCNNTYHNSIYINIQENEFYTNTL